MEISWVNILADLLLVLAMVVCTFVGKARGFIKTFFGFFGSLIAFVASTFLSRPVGNFLMEKIILPPMRDFVKSKAAEIVGSGAEGLESGALLSAGDEFFSRFGVNTEQVKTYADEMGSEGAENLTDVLAEYIASPLASAVGVALAFILLFIVFAVLIRVLVKVFDLIARLPILNFSNRFLGAGVGFLWGVLIAVLLATALTILTPTIQSSENPFLSGFSPEKTYLLRFLNKIQF